MYTVRMMLEPGPGCPVPFTLEMRRADGSIVKQIDLFGKQRVTLPIPVDVPTLLSLTLHATKPGKATSVDVRVLSFRVFDIDFDRSSADVLPFSMQLGKGWHPLETQNGSQFRWIDNDAEIVVQSLAPEEFSIDAEAGPSLDTKKFRLYVLGDRGETVAESEIDGRGRFQVNLANTQSRKLKLHIDGGGKRLTSDPRVMNFRVFRSVAL